MGWADNYITSLEEGETVSFRPRGNSMLPKIKSGQLCTVVPLTEETELRKNDIVLCKVRSYQYLHLIKAIKGQRYQIANNRGHINGWISKSAIFGKLIAIED